jgi:hypothetical protein
MAIRDLERRAHADESARESKIAGVRRQRRDDGPIAALHTAEYRSASCRFISTESKLFCANSGGLPSERCAACSQGITTVILNK